MINLKEAFGFSVGLTLVVLAITFIVLAGMALLIAINEIVPIVDVLLFSLGTFVGFFIICVTLDAAS